MGDVGRDNGMYPFRPLVNPEPLMVIGASRGVVAYTTVRMPHMHHRSPADRTTR
jgi:hypothetical protein